MSGRNIILAGIPRSGTTLTCHLLNKLPNVVALHEPLVPTDYRGLAATVIIERLGDFFDEQRRSLLHDGTATSKAAGGRVPDNSMGGVDDKTGKRRSRLDGRTLVVDKSLDPDFDLAVKQPNFFTAKLGDLVEPFHCYAIVRNPLAALLSWNSVDMPVSRGYAPGAEAFDKDLSARLRNEEDLLSRQIILISWYFDTYRRLLPPERILRYENMIASGGRELTKITGAAQQLDEPLVSKNDSRFYDPKKKKAIAETLLAGDGGYWSFYDREEVVGLL
jgi:hypothetical protein